MKCSMGCLHCSSLIMHDHMNSMHMALPDNCLLAVESKLCLRCLVGTFYLLQLLQCVFLMVWQLCMSFDSCLWHLLVIKLVNFWYRHVSVLWGWPFCMMCVLKPQSLQQWKTAHVPWWTSKTIQYTTQTLCWSCYNSRALNSCIKSSQTSHVILQTSCT